MAAHTALGSLLALASLQWAPAAIPDALAGVALWVVGLNGGTLAINSAFDRDEGDIAYLRAPPRVPTGLCAFGLTVMLLGLSVAAWLLPPLFVLLFAVCVLLSILYSVPPFRLKSVPYADWMINLLGFGALTPLAGWAATGAPVSVSAIVLFAGFGLLFAALYPLTQLYQMEEDRARGDRTLVLRLGAARALTLALLATLAAFALFTVAGAGLGWPLRSWRWLPLVCALGLWLLVLVPWRRRASRLKHEHQAGMYRALSAWAITDVAVALTWLVATP